MERKSESVTERESDRARDRERKSENGLRTEHIRSSKQLFVMFV